MSGGDQEDLDFNPFFVALQKKFPKVYAQAQDSCYMILVPKATVCAQAQPLASTQYLNY